MSVDITTEKRFESDIEASLSPYGDISKISSKELYA